MVRSSPPPPIIASVVQIPLESITFFSVSFIFRRFLNKADAAVQQLLRPPLRRRIALLQGTKQPSTQNINGTAAAADFPPELVAEEFVVDEVDDEIKEAPMKEIIMGIDAII